MFEHLTRGPAHHRQRLRLRELGAHRRMLNSWDHLEERALLAALPLSLISENLANNGADVGALFPSISADGQYVAFESGSFEGESTPAPSDLVNGLTVENDAPNVYLRDLATNTTICLSVDYQAPDTTGNDDSRYPIISADGNTVVFLSNATDLVSDDNPSNNPNDDINVFAWSRATGKLTLVTVNYEGSGPANDPNPQSFGTAENISVSANGDDIAYDSEATNLVTGENDNNYTPNVYVYDLLTNTNILVSASDTENGIGNAPSDDPVISADGSTVAYDSLASDLDPNLSSPEQFENYQVYASTLNYTHDTVASTTLVSVDPTDTTAGDNTSIAPSLSDNGQMVAFQSASDNLVNIPNGGSYNDVYVRDLATNTTQLVSIDDTGDATGDSSSFAPQISGDGDHVLFYSLADDLTATPVNTQTNVFERNLTTDTTQLVSVNYEGAGGANDTSTLANQTFANSSQQAYGQISDNGQYVIFESVATDLVPNFQQENGGSPYGTDVYLRDTVGGTTTLLSHAVGTTTTGGTGISVDTDMSPDLLNVAFQSAFSGGTDNLVSNDTNDQTQLFDAGQAPLAAATTEAATSVTATGATLKASVNPEGSATTYSFVYGTNSTLTSGTTTTTAQSAGSGTSALSETAALTGLTVGTTYYDRVVATNAGGTTLGAILSFTTPAVLQFSSGQFTANVSAGSGQVVLARAGNLNTTLSVLLSSPGGHEVAPFSEMVTFGPNVLSRTVPVTIINDGQPGENDTVIPLSLSSPGPGATLGASASASLVIVDNNPPLVTITSFQHPTIKVGTGKKAKKEVVLQFQFSGPVNGAGNLAAYVLKSGQTKKGKTTYTKPVTLTSAVYNYPGTPRNTVTLFLKKALNLSVPEQLTANASLITDSYGHPLAHNFVVTFSNKGVTIE